MQQEVRFLLEDILEYGREATDTVGDLSVEQILAERLREHAVLRTIQIVGEAVAQALKREPDVLAGLGFERAVSLRNVLVHGYAKVRMEEVVQIIRHDLPRLLAAVEHILGEQT